MTIGIKTYPWGMSGTIALRPSIVREGDYVGQKYLATDEDKWYESDGDEWLEVYTPESTQLALAQFPATLAGDGLAGSDGTALSVGVDGSSIEISADALRVKAGGVTNTMLAGSIARSKLAGAMSKMTVADGTAAAANVTVAGMVVGDELVGVLALTTKASIATLVNRTGEYVVGAGVLTKAAGTDETNNQLVIFWNDLT